MCQRVLPRTSFEERLPEGWFLSRLYKGNRILYYNNVKVASLADSFDIESKVNAIINNPPEAVQAALYQDGRMPAIELSSNIQKKLVKKGIIPYEFALNCLHSIESWLYKIIPARQNTTVNSTSTSVTVGTTRTVIVSTQHFYSCLPGTPEFVTHKENVLLLM